MHEIDRRVGFEQIAPGPLAGIRLAGYQKHPQLVAYAVDRDHGAIVDLRQFVVERRRLDLDDIRAAMRDRNLDLLRDADRNSALVDYVAVAAHRHFGGAGVRALILDPVSDGLRLADDAEARRGNQRNAAVAFVRVPGDQRVDRRGKAERGGVGGHIVDAAVGDHDDAGDAIGRHVGERRTERGE